MRKAAPQSPPVAMTIAGSDSGAGAGIQADLGAMAATDVWGTSVITAVTAQHTHGVEDVQVLDPATVRAQFEAVIGDMDVQAVKTGMLATTDVVETVRDCLEDRSAPLVVDPVMVAESGDRLLDETAIDPYTHLIQQATLVTPNADEASLLTDLTVDDVASAKQAAAGLVEMGAGAALITGGHLPGDEVPDVYHGPDRTETLVHERIDTAATHGTGCTLSATITGFLACGYELFDAVTEGIETLQRGIRYNSGIGEGPGAVNATVRRQNAANMASTLTAINDICDELAGDIAPLLTAKSGMALVGCPPTAETPEDVLVVDPGITEGGDVSGQIRTATDHDLAWQLLAAREGDPGIRFAGRCQLDRAAQEALATTGWPTVEINDEATALDRGSSTAEDDPPILQDGETSTILGRDRDGFVARVAQLATVLQNGQ